MMIKKIEPLGFGLAQARNGEAMFCDGCGREQSGPVLELTPEAVGDPTKHFCMDCLNMYHLLLSAKLRPSLQQQVAANREITGEPLAQRPAAA